MKQYKVFVVANLVLGILLIALTKSVTLIIGDKGTKKKTQSYRETEFFFIFIKNLCIFVPLC